MSLDLCSSHKASSSAEKNCGFLKQAPQQGKRLWFRTGKEKKRRAHWLWSQPLKITNCFHNYFGSPQRCADNIFRRQHKGINAFNEPGCGANPRSSWVEGDLWNNTLQAPPSARLQNAAAPPEVWNSCTNPIKAPCDNKWAAAELNSTCERNMV